MGRDHEFTTDWFSPHVKDWQRFLSHLAGRPNLAILEVGSFEGRSTVWLLENVATHETSRIDCIDTFEGSVEHKEMDVPIENIEMVFDKNIQTSHAEFKIRKLKGKSQELLRDLSTSHYDVAYIDGSHMAVDVLEDAVMAFRLLKDGGVLIFDDYEWRAFVEDTHTPKLGIDAFLRVFRGRYELLSKGYQVILRKTPQSEVHTWVKARETRNPDFRWPDNGWRQRVNASIREITPIIPPGDMFILVDGGQWGDDGVVSDRRHVPFIEHEGQYWGPPPDGATAIRELERLRRAGAGFIVFVWPAFWWLDHYTEFHCHLRSKFRCVLDNDRVVMFDLRP
jgi:predicted O-methyltransferase YrrM